MLTVDDLNAARAQWEEWTAGAPFELSIEVHAGPPKSALIYGESTVSFAGRSYGSVHSRITVETYALVQVRHRCGGVVFDQAMACEAAAVKASVSVLARMIAAMAQEGDGG